MANMSAADVPEELLAEILVRLPVKSLLICKSVRKSWLSIISSPNFIQSHRRRSIPTLVDFVDPAEPASKLDLYPPYEPVLGPDHLKERWRLLTNKAILDAQGQDLSAFDSIVRPSLFANVWGNINSCVNGIVIVCKNDGYGFYLWNPSIRKCKEISPPPSIKYGRLLGQCWTCIGYDSICNDYKVLMIVYGSMSDDVPQVYLYSTNADCWREFPSPITECEDDPRTHILVNEIIYFNCMDKLLSFDFHQEVFGLIPYPSCIQKTRSDLLDFEGSVAIVFESILGVDLWTLDDISGEFSWTRKFNIKPDWDDWEMEIRLFYYLGARQFYGENLFNYMHLYDVLYDYEKKETKYYKLGKKSARTIIKFTETLVSLDGFEQVE